MQQYWLLLRNFSTPDPYEHAHPVQQVDLQVYLLTDLDLLTDLQLDLHLHRHLHLHLCLYLCLRVYLYQLQE